MKIVLDENICRRLSAQLRGMGHEVTSVSDLPGRSMPDTEVWDLAKRQNALLVTRDTHFTNPIRFDPAECQGILFLRHGNLTAARECELVSHFIQEFDPALCVGRLVSLSPHEIRYR
jgi:predicted nuclease of predicted toxin-antitoxin system